MAVCIPKFLRDLTKIPTLNPEGRMVVTRVHLSDDKQIGAFFESLQNDPGDPSCVLPQYDLAWWEYKSPDTELTESRLFDSFMKKIQQVCLIGTTGFRSNLILATIY